MIFYMASKFKVKACVIDSYKAHFKFSPYKVLIDFIPRTKLNAVINTYLISKLIIEQEINENLRHPKDEKGVSWIT